jgi:hypothetical protein
VDVAAPAIMSGLLVGGRPIGWRLHRTRAITVEVASRQSEPARRPAPIPPRGARR